MKKVRVKNKSINTNKKKATDANIKRGLYKYSIQVVAKKYGNKEVYDYMINHTGTKLTKYYLYGTNQLITKEQLQGIIEGMFIDTVSNYYIFGNNLGAIFYDASGIIQVTEMLDSEYELTHDYTLPESVQERYNLLREYAIKYDMNHVNGGKWSAFL